MPGVHGRSGARPKTVKQHELEGTKRAHHRGYTNADPPLGEPPKPRGLSRIESQAWADMVGRLRVSKTLAVTDDEALFGFVKAHALVERLSEEFNALPSLVYYKHTQVLMPDGNTIEHKEPKIHPVVAQFRAAILTLKAILVEFGQTPSSRGKVQIPETLEADPFDEFDSTKAKAH